MTKFPMIVGAGFLMISTSDCASYVKLNDSTLSESEKKGENK